MMQRNWWTAITSRKILRREQNADGADGKQGGKVFSIQLFSFKKLLFRYDGLNLIAYNSLKMSTFTDTRTPRAEGGAESAHWAAEGGISRGNGSWAQWVRQQGLSLLRCEGGVGWVNSVTLCEGNHEKYEKGNKKSLGCQNSNQGPLC